MPITFTQAQAMADGQSLIQGTDVRPLALMHAINSGAVSFAPQQMIHTNNTTDHSASGRQVSPDQQFQDQQLARGGMVANRDAHVLGGAQAAINGVTPDNADIAPQQNPIASALHAGLAGLGLLSLFKH